MYLYLPRSDGTPCRQLPTLNAVSLTTLPPYPYTLPSTSDIFGQTCTSTIAIRILCELKCTELNGCMDWMVQVSRCMWSNVFDMDDLTNGQSMHAYMMAAEGHLNIYLSLLSLSSPSLSHLLHAHTEQAQIGACMHTHMYTVGELVSSIGNP